MIADIYKCHECDVNVYLTGDEDLCPICGGAHRLDMKEVSFGVDLSVDSELGEGAQYANFGHFVEVMGALYGDKSGLYLMDCWKYAWDAKKTDSVNIENVKAFIENPNAYVHPVHTMTYDELEKEVQRIVTVILDKCWFPEDDEEAIDEIFSYVDKTCLFRLFVKKDLTNISADILTEHTIETSVYNYASVEKKNPAPKNIEGFYVLEGRLSNKSLPRTYFKDTAKDIAERVSYLLFRITKKKDLWSEILGLFSNKKETFILKLTSK